MRISFTLKLSFLFLLSAFVAVSGRSQAIIAQQSDHSAGGLDITNYDDPMMGPYYSGLGQSFKAVATNYLGSIQFYVSNINPSGTANVAVYSCSSATVWGSLLGTKTGIPITTTGWVTVDVTSLHIAVTAGNFYGFKILPQAGLQSLGEVSSNGYPDGDLVLINDDGSQYSFGGPYFLGFIITSASSLPVTLTSFTVQKQGNAALLQWSTATEQNSKDFIVQHSVDGNNWSNIAILSAAGNSNALLSYSYIHTAPAAGNNYYRLLQTDIDGKSNYSEVRTVAFAAGESSFTVLANPVSNGVLQVKLYSAGMLSLYSPDGRLLWTKQLDAGLQSLDMSRYGKGVFVLKGNESVEKIMVQ